MNPNKVRAIVRATRIAGQPAPYDTLSLKIYYPCKFSDSAQERNTGVVAADARRAPLPVVILLPDSEISHEGYSWLAGELAEAGFAAVTYSWIAEDPDGHVRSGPGVHLKRMTPKRLGRKPSCPALPAVMAELKRVNRSSPLDGKLNLSSVIFGGHAVGGRMALLNANTDWFPEVCGAFSYAGHTVAESQLGWEKRQVMPMASDLPLLIMGGTEDRVIASGKGRDAATGTDKIERTFRHGIKGKRGDRHLVLVDGANHFSFVYPKDRTTGLSFLDSKSSGRGKQIRKYLAKVIVTFCDQVCCGNPMSTADLQALCDSSHPMVAVSEHK